MDILKEQIEAIKKQNEVIDERIELALLEIALLTYEKEGKE